MVLAFAVLLFHITPNIQAVPKAAVATIASAQPANVLPAAPVPNKAAADATTATNSGSRTLYADSAAPAAQNSQALETIHVPELPVGKPTKTIGVENAPSRKAWILLSIADHSAATFDAYTTRAAISRGAVEADPVIRPFAGSDALYAAIQVAPVALDFIARHMQRSENGLLRRSWWVPQSAATGLFLFAGSHNLTVAGR
ncbi:MAG: hypothetical protein WBQ34_11150 [Candidatus Acidiferrales bacterium]